MNFYLFKSSFLLTILLLFTEVYSNIDYYHPGETKFEIQQRYSVPLEPNQLISQEQQYNIELIQQVNILNQSSTLLSENNTLFHFKQITPEEDDAIMILNNSNLQCLYKIKNYLLNQQLQITPHFCNIPLPHQICSKVIQFNKKMFITNCKVNLNEVMISIINLDGKVFDEIKFEIESNCNIEFSYGFSHLLVYQSYCNSNNIYQVEIDEVQYQFKSINKLEVEDIKNSSNQKLIQIDMCEKKRIYLIYEKLILSYDMEDIKYEENYYDINATILKTFQACLGVKSVLDVKDYTQQLRINSNLLNLSHFQYVNAYIMESILVFHFNDYIIAKINEQLKQYVNISVLQILPLDGYPFFASIYESGLQLFQMQPPKCYHTFNHSQRVLFLVFYNVQPLSQFTQEQSNIEILYQSKPRLIIGKSEFKTYLQNDDHEICIQQSEISITLPLILQTLIDNQKEFQINKKQVQFNCVINYEQNQELLYFGDLMQNIKVIILLKQKNTIKLAYCQDNNFIMQQEIKLKNNIIDYSIFKKQNLLMIFQEQSITIITFEIEFQIKVIEIPEEKKILKAARYFDQIYILYDDCSIATLFYQFGEIRLIEQVVNYPFNCTQTYSFTNRNLFIGQNEIFYLSNLNKKYNIEGGNITKVLIDVASDFYILIFQEGNETILKLFRLFKGEFVFCYIIPTYNFQYEPSNAQKFQNFYLMISAKDSNSKILHLLVYDLKNDAVNSLIYFTEIDQSLQFYDFYDLNLYTLVFFNNGSFFFQYFNKICFNYKVELSNTIFTFKKIEIVLITFIKGLSTSIQFEIYKLNNNYSLISYNKKIKNISNEVKFNLEEINGNIVKIDIQPIQDYKIKLPLNITQESFYCKRFESGMCINQINQLKINSLNLNDTIPIHQQAEIKYIGFNQESLIYSIIYASQNHDQLILITMKLEQFNENQYRIINIEQTKINIPKEQLIMLAYIKIIKDIYYCQVEGKLHILFYKTNCQIIELFNYKIERYQYIDGTIISNQTYLFIQAQPNKILMQFIEFTDIQQNQNEYCKYDIIQYHEIDVFTITKVQFDQFQIFINKIEILHLKKISNSYVVKLIIIYQFKFSFVVELSFDSIRYDNIQIQSYIFLRYEANAQFLGFLYADDTFILMTFYKDQKQQINVFEIQGNMKNKNYVDSIQRLESKDKKKVEKYNSSHYVISDNTNEIVFFMTLDKLKIECQGLCDKPANLILSNDISSINFEMQQEIYLNDSQQYFNVLTVKLGITFVNVIFIFLQIKYKRKTKTRQVQIDFKRIGSQ